MTRTPSNCDFDMNAVSNCIAIAHAFMFTIFIWLCAIVRHLDMYCPGWICTFCVHICVIFVADPWTHKNSYINAESWIFRRLLALRPHMPPGSLTGLRKTPSRPDFSIIPVSNWIGIFAFAKIYIYWLTELLGLFLLFVLLIYFSKLWSNLPLFLQNSTYFSTGWCAFL